MDEEIPPRINFRSFKNFESFLFTTYLNYLKSLLTNLRSLKDFVNYILWGLLVLINDPAIHIHCPCKWVQILISQDSKLAAGDRAFHIESRFEFILRPLFLYFPLQIIRVGKRKFADEG